MENKKPTFFDKENLDNSLCNLYRYISFLEIVSFALKLLFFSIGALMILFGLLQLDYYLLRLGVIIFLVTAAIYLFFVKPLLLILYAVCKILINSEKDKE